MFVQQSTSPQYLANGGGTISRDLTDGGSGPPARRDDASGTDQPGGPAGAQAPLKINTNPGPLPGLYSPRGPGEVKSDVAHDPSPGPNTRGASASVQATSANPGPLPGLNSPRGPGEVESGAAPYPLPGPNTRGVGVSRQSKARPWSMRKLLLDNALKWRLSQ